VFLQFARAAGVVSVMRALRFVFVLWLGLLGAGRADDVALRAAIGKGLGYLAKEGEQWMEVKSCNSCHHVPLLLWNYREAGERGFAVDANKVKEWLAWAQERVTDKNLRSEEASLMILAMPERVVPEWAMFLMKDQKPDGSWTPAGQFSTMQKRGTPDAAANAARLNLVALGSCAAEVAAVRKKADPVLAKRESPTATESLVFRTLYVGRFGRPEEIAEQTEQLLSHQRGDGGWASFIGENMSDPLATGQVLYALQSFAKDAKVTAAITRAQAWLLATQRPDGSWVSEISHISKMDRSAPAKAKSLAAATEIYHYWGSAWATLGLLHGLPKAE